MIFDAIQEWFQELLIDGIISNLTGMFDTLNTKVGEIAGEVGMTPAAWNSGIFNMVRNLSETVIVPIASIVLTFVMCYELIQLIIEKNNLHDFDTWIFFKWIFKTFCAVLIVTNTWNIVMAVFDVAQNVVSQSAGVIISDAGIDISSVTADLETQLADWSIGALLGLWFQSIFVGLCTQILSICIFLVIYPGGVHGDRGQHPGDHAHPGHQPERGHQDGQAQDHRFGRHEDRGAETGGTERIRYGHQCDSFLNKAFVVEGQNQALTKERKFQMLGELTIREVE